MTITRIEPLAPPAPVDWSAYAEVYDLMADNNPAYQDLLAQFRRSLTHWELRPGAVIADLGAGTGNFSLLAAGQFPGARVVHLDADPAMNALARSKAAARGLRNVELRPADIGAAAFAPDSVDAIVTVHALYAFPDPRETIRRMHAWLRPGGYVWACDLGRHMDIGDWRRFMFGELRRRHGLLHTARLFVRGRAVTRENRRIAAAQRDGRYWTHDLAAFRAAFEAAGFAVTAGRTAYRGYSDVVEGRKAGGAA